MTHVDVTTLITFFLPKQKLATLAIQSAIQSVMRTSDLMIYLISDPYLGGTRNHHEPDRHPLGHGPLNFQTHFRVVHDSFN